ncbi:MAG: hydrolase [Armatimonadota bacterium]
MRHPNILDESGAALLVIDLQDSLLKAIHEHERVVANSVKLIETAKIFSIPILVTLQYAQRLGDVTQAVADALPHDTRMDKMTFSCVDGEGFIEALEQTGRRQVIICGVETHVCVNQTAHDLLARGYSVHIVKDAVSSRTPANWATGIEKMRDSGCVITSTETAIFELIRDASRAEFKKILPLIK